MNQCLPRPILRMSLACGDEFVRDVPESPKRRSKRAGSCSQQVRSLVGREAARETQSQSVGIKQTFRLVNRLDRRP